MDVGKTRQVLKQLMEDMDGEDAVSMDVPFLTRVLEVVRENIRDDDQLHQLVTSLVKSSQQNEVLTMETDGEMLSNFESHDEAI